MPIQPASNDYTTLLYEALAEPVGIIIHTTGRMQSVMGQLYRARDLLADPALDVLSISPSPTAPDSELWLYHKEAYRAPQEGV